MNRILTALSLCSVVASSAAAPAPDDKLPLLVVSNRTGSANIFLVAAD
jgi:hypothetical protein